MTEQDRQEARAELARVRGALAQATGRRRVDLILEAKDPGAIVRGLPADELWLTVREVGLGDAMELVQLASPQQFKVFLDLEVWRKDEPDTLRALPWLRAARAGSGGDDRAHERWTAKLRALDIELLELVLVDTLRIHDLEKDPDPEIEGDRFLRTPENRFIVEFTVDGTDYVAVRGLVDDLYAEDPFRAGRLLSAVRWEFRSELVETAFRWREGRLADLGHPPLEEALSWFAKPASTPASATSRAGAPARPPGFFLASVRGGGLLERAAAALSEPARERLQLQLVMAANAVLVADEVDLEDSDAVRGAMAAARALVDLGLAERAAGGDPSAVLASTPVKALFQAGFARLLALRWRAERLLATGKAGTKQSPALDPPLDDVIRALVRRRPRYFPGVEAPREEWGTPAAGAFQPRPFLSPEDLARTAAALDEAERIVAAR